jgi:nickel-dependent lactate racemase
MILTTPCPEGIGVTHSDQVEYLALDSGELLQRIDTGQVKDPIAAAVCVKVALLRERSHVVVVSPGLREEEVRMMGFDYYHCVQEALEAMLVMFGQDNQVAVLTHGGETVPCVQTRLL